MNNTSKWVTPALILMLAVSVAGAWTVQQIGTWTKVTRTQGQVGFVMSNGYHLYSNDPYWDSCIWGAEDTELECIQENCSNLGPPQYQVCVGECHDLYLAEVHSCNDLFPILVNNGSDQNDGFPE